MINIKKDYWFLWQDGVSAFINVYRIFGHIILRKWHQRRARRAIGACPKCGTIPGEKPTDFACGKHILEWEKERQKRRELVEKIKQKHNNY